MPATDDETDMQMLALSDEQSRAKDEIRRYLEGSRTSPFVLNGLAGTGKTTVLAQIAEEYRQAYLCTLTGKAASILRRKTGLPACTIHSAFYRLEEVQKDKRGRQMPTFKRVHDDGQLYGNIVLIDECSMINHEIARDLLSTGAKIVACGDPGQLPPVSGERFFSRADTTLQTIHRQALESPIIRQAHRVRAGLAYENDGDDFQVKGRDVPDDDVRDAGVILCYTNKTRQFANQYARGIHGIFQTTPQVGEPIICLKNVADFGIYNGATYQLEAPFIEGDRDIHINVEGQIVCVPGVTFEGVRSGLNEDEEPLTSFGFGYAMTVHKAQGSEWDNVVLMDEYRRSEHRREWIYTAITRAAKRIVVVG